MDAGAADTRLVLIVDIDAVQLFATVVVLSPETDMGSSVDRLIRKQESALPFDLVALTDVAGPAWFVQLGPALARIGTEFGNLPVAGIPLRDDQDGRWSWKEQELDALIALTAECRYQLLDGEPSTVADPLAFDLDHVGLFERTSIVQATFHLAKHHRVLIPAEALSGRVVPMNHQGFETFEALILVAQQNSDLLLPFSRQQGGAKEDLELRHVESDPLPDVIIAAAHHVGDSIRCIRIASVSSLWRDKRAAAAPLFWSVDIAGRRHQVGVTEVDTLAAIHA